VNLVGHGTGRRWATFKGIAASLVCTGALIGGSLMLTPAAAQATSAAFTTLTAPAHLDDLSCTFRVNDSDIGALCTHPGPDIHHYRAWVECTDGREHVGDWYAVNSGAWSFAHCKTNTFLVNYGVDLSPPS
jgi:hypothetical protein